MRFFFALTCVFAWCFSHSASAQVQTFTDLSNRVFVLVIAESGMKRGIDRLGLQGTFCPASSKVVRYCREAKGQPNLQTKGRIAWQVKTSGSKLRFTMSVGRFGSPPGRYYYVSSGSTVVQDATYFVDVKPGTVVVFNLLKTSDQAAISLAKEQLSERYGAEMSNLNYVPGGAVTASCNKVFDPKDAVCTIGKETSIVNLVIN